MYGVSGARTNWTEQTIDLSVWRMEPNLRVRFRLMTDAVGVDDGWTIDDVTIGEHPPALIAPPFAEGFENGLTNWITAPWAWQVGASNMYEGGGALQDAVTIMGPDVQAYLPLGAAFNLVGTTDPQLTFWVKGHVWVSYGHVGVQVSTDGGLNWAEPWAAGSGWNYPDWTRVQLSLNAW